MRIGDVERERVVDRLRTAFAEGRLEQSELEDRLDATYQAKTESQLVPLVSDLPGAPLPVAAAMTPEPQKISLAKDPTVWAILGPMIGVSILVTIIWAITTGPGHYFWPVWVYLGMGVPAAGSVWTVWLARQKAAGQIDPDHRRDDDDDDD